MSVREELSYTKAREQMVRQQITARGIRARRVLAAMRTVPRHLFVPEDLHHLAYYDSPLSIGLGQTISQPYIVALMTEALELKEHENVLEIGTGSGYQAAILGQLVKHVYTVERIQELATRAQDLFRQLCYDNISVRVDDGTKGWPEHAPYQAVIITAASPDVPKPLTEQLAEGGRLVGPIGGSWTQSLIQIHKQGGDLNSRELTTVAFVPLIGEYGWSEKK